MSGIQDFITFLARYILPSPGLSTVYHSLNLSGWSLWTCSSSSLNKMSSSVLSQNRYALLSKSPTFSSICRSKETKTRLNSQGSVSETGPLRPVEHSICSSWFIIFLRVARLIDLEIDHFEKLYAASIFSKTSMFFRNLEVGCWAMGKLYIRLRAWSSFWFQKHMHFGNPLWIPFWNP